MPRPLSRRRVLAGALSALPLVAWINGWSPAQAADAAPLAAYRWQNRPFLIFAPSRDHPGRLAQLRLFNAVRTGLQDRDMVLIDIAGSQIQIDGTPTTTMEIEALRAFYDVPAPQFAVLLVGKDGDVKYRGDTPVDADTLFALIDSMPMRRREMRERDG